jgi:PIN domain
MKINYILIDYENVQPKNLALLAAEHFRVVVFVGQAQQSVPIGLATALQSFGKRAGYVRISGNGPNALDFHIAYYIGRLVSQDKTAYLHIISKDTGFDPLIAHLRERGIEIRRWPGLENIPILRAQTLAASPGSPLARSDAPGAAASPVALNAASASQATTSIRAVASAATPRSATPIPPAPMPAAMPPAAAAPATPTDTVIAHLRKMAKNLPGNEKALRAAVGSWLQKHDGGVRERVMQELRSRKVVRIDASGIHYALGK